MLTRLNEAASRLNYLGIPTKFTITRFPESGGVHVHFEDSLEFKVALTELLADFLENLQDDREEFDGRTNDGSGS